MADLVTLVHAAVKATVADLPTAEGFSTLAFLDSLAAVAGSLWD